MELKHFTGEAAVKGTGVLIVPYGIETFAESAFDEVFKVLIVPYGIETISTNQIIQTLRSVNCTLWN